MLTRIGLEPPPGFQARQFEEAADIVAFDLVLVMDKFTAADVLREVRLGFGCFCPGMACWPQGLIRVRNFEKLCHPPTTGGR